MFAFESRWLPAEDLGEGPLPNKYLGVATLALFVAALGTMRFVGMPEDAATFIMQTLIALLLSRLIALDLVYLVLPDVYTIPLALIGLLWAATGLGINIVDAGIGAATGFAFTFAFMYLLYKLKGDAAGLGGGDLKLISAAGAWLGLSGLFLMLPLACIISICLLFLPFKNNEIPFGPGLCTALWLVLITSDQFYLLLV